MSYSFFILTTEQALKAYFAWKQLKLDYSKNIWKEENHGQGFVCLLFSYISEKKTLKTVIQLVQELAVSFWPNFDHNFTNIFEECKKGEWYILKKVGL